MHLAQEHFPNDLQDMVSWIVDACPPQGRVLEIGCGDGTVTNKLAEMGIDVVGVDPEARASDNIFAIAFEDLEADPFDVVFASVSLHHLTDPKRATEALRRLTKSGSKLLVREFDKDLLNHRPTLEWWFHQRRAKLASRPESEAMPDHPHSFDSFDDFDSFAEARHRMMEHHVLPWPVVSRFLADAGFVTNDQSATSYLYRWELDEALRPLEEALIERGHINAVGIRWAGRRSS